MNIKNAKELLMKTIPAGLPILIKGAPGVGKTDVVTQVAKKLKYDLITVIPAIADPTDAKGFPGKVDGHYEWQLCGDAYRITKAKKKTIVFIDDLGQAPAVVQAAFMQWILLRRIGEHDVPDCVVFVAATNRRQDKAGVTSILEPVKSRFATIIELEPDADEWIEWAFDHDMPAELIGFINFRPALLHEGKATNDIVNHPCPRTIANAGKLINIGLDDIETLAGAVGEGCAVELVGFISVYNSLPNISAILIDPENAIVPDEPAALYAIVSALVDKITKDNSGRILKYGNRLPDDFSVLLVRDSVRKEPKIQNTKAFIKWATLHKNVLL